MKTLYNENYTVTKSDGHRIIVVSDRALTAARTIAIDGAEVGRDLTLLTLNSHFDTYQVSIVAGSDRIGGGTDLLLTNYGQSVRLVKVQSGLWLPVAGIDLSRSGIASSVMGSGGIVRAVFAGSLTDATATTLFRVRTSNESGSADGGTYTVIAHVHISNGASSGSSAAAARSQRLIFSRAQIAAGTGVNSTLQVENTSPLAATDAATRTITTVSASLVEASEYIQDLKLAVTGGGSASVVLAFVAEVTLFWNAFLSAPRLTKS